MKISAYDPRRPSDEPGIPEEFYRVLEPADDQIEDLTVAVGGNLTMEDNLGAEIKTLPFKQDTEATVYLRRVKDVLTVILGVSSVYDYAKVKWQQTDKGQVKMAIKWDTDPGEPKNVEVIFIPR